MAYALAGFNPIGGQSRAGVAPMVWSYTSTDAIATIVTDGYFNSLRDDLEANDMIVVVSSSGGTVAFTLIFVATAPKSPLATDVTISALDINAA
uniref:Uncharacterized protein n=1 Tax=uncultured marine virus TaxID=186617 RepID=A0A0F7L452_9VIRU|nr:hypothetical protein [uncultured marine virus]